MGKDAGNKLTGLLKQHILIAVDLIEAAKAPANAWRSGSDPGDCTEPMDSCTVAASVSESRHD